MSETLLKLSEGLAEAVRKAGQSVVRVEGRRRLAGTGIVWSGDGLVLSASHVVRKHESIKVGLPDGNVSKARVVGRDDTTDLALLQVEASGLTPVEAADASSLAVGHLALALGRPGRTVQATLGIISALGDKWRTGAGGEVNRYLQTDVVMYPGFSGGPLVNVEGGLIGLNSSALSRGVSLTLPYQTLARVADALASTGTVKRGYLGISTQAVRLPRDVSEELGQETGLLIAGVESDSPAEQGGLYLGDTILALEDQAISHHDDLISMLSADRVGASTSFRILRGGAIQSVDVVIGERS